MKEFKILFLQHAQRGSYLEEPGHTEIVLPFKSQSAVSVDIREVVYQDLCKKYNNRGVNNSHINEINLEKELLNRIKQSISGPWKPNLVIVNRTFHSESLGPSILTSIKEITRCKLAQFYFDHDEGNEFFLNDEKMDSIISDINVQLDSIARVHKIRNKSGIYADWGNNTSWIWSACPVQRNKFYFDKKRKGGIGVIGSLDGMRSECFNALSMCGLKIVNGGGIMNKSKYLDEVQYAALMRSIDLSIIPLTMNHLHTDKPVDQIKGRVFQSIATRSTPIIQETPSAKMLFGNELITYKNMKELINIVEIFKENKKLSNDYSSFVYEKYNHYSSPSLILKNLISLT